MMQQFYEIKANYPDCILFFRLGDFYEMFDEDAVAGAEILDITLTARTKGEDAIPMCGVPYHSAEGYILKLTHAGKKVAICEQVSDPKLPGLVKRDVVRVVTPGTNISSNYLDTRISNYALAVTGKPDGVLGVAYGDISTGDVFLDQIQAAGLRTLLEKVDPAEIILNKELAEAPALFRLFSEKNLAMTQRANVKQPVDSLVGALGVKQLDGFDLDLEQDKLAIQAAANLYNYLESTQKRELTHLNKLVRLRNQTHLHLDATTIQNLELFFTQKDRSRHGSLFSVINQTVTRPGTRMLARWLLNPLQSVSELEVRQSHVDVFFADSALRTKLRNLLKPLPDLQRLASRIALNQGSPRDLAAIRSILGVLPALKNTLQNAAAPINKFGEKLPLAKALRDLLIKAVAEHPPVSVSELGIIADGYSAEIDELRSLHADHGSVMDKFLELEKEETGIANLKIGSNKVIGFYLEVSKGKVELVPDHYIAKQTLTNANRYITPELKAYEEKLLTAEAGLQQLETKLCGELFAQVLANQVELANISEMLAKLDCWLGLAELAVSNRYTKPTLIESGDLKIVGGRHPVVEKLLPTGAFVHNDSCFSSEERLIVLTGPNMGGKSTYLRQTALAVLLAQMGSYVPADQAIIPVVDRIFTRVGASDNLGRGQSTFMVEMQELAVILNQATERSLLIIDEIGRGTSTYDGVSIAWATLEFIHNQIRATTLFATHYHELVDVAEEMPHAANYSMAVHEEAEEVVFLHQVIAGGMNDSYGIEVAKRAGIPKEVVTDAQTKLRTLEEGYLADRIHQSLNKKDPDPNQLDMFGVEVKHPLLEELAELNVNELTPMQALQQIAKWREEIQL